MTKRDKILALLLSFFGVSGLLAVFAVGMPMSWMAGAHSWLGLGDMPSASVVEYLARSISAFYALFGGICLALATDLRRYRPLVRLMGLLVVAMGAAFIGIDLSATMPWWWSTIEGPTTIIGGATMFLLARPDLENG